MNSRFLESEFDYVKPVSLNEAVTFMSENKNVRVFAGGTDLIVKMKMDAIPDIDFMLDINAIDELKRIKRDAENDLVIGAATKLTAIEKNPEVAEHYLALKEAISKMASISIRNMGTIGGNFCNASPVADTVGPVICFNGQVELTGIKGTRLVNAEKFFTAPGVNVREKEELMTAVVLPPEADNTGSAFIKFGRVASDIAKISLTTVIVRDGNKIKSCRIAMGSVAATPLFLKDISESLTGKEMTAELIKETAETISATIKPITDTRTTAEYRKQTAIVIAEEALAVAWERSGGK